jgi:hypothetical protein
MPQAVAWLKEFKENPSKLETSIQQDREHLEVESDPRWRATLERSTSMREHLLESPSALDFCLPTQTFDGELIFHGTQRIAELFSVAPGHTVSDA